MKLLIAIPALNEEESIESIIRRSLDARAHIIQHSPVKEVEITVVSDGSTDRTVEIAQRFTDSISLIIFKKNRGYGAAIKAAWEKSNADLLSFLDADGTCDPKFFADLCSHLSQTDSDIVLGCRLNSKSKMPLIRRAGNIFYALLLTVFSSKRVRDTASGMRVVRRSALDKIMPLPDGLHFTPAMSARAILSPDLKITEIDMPYEERQGESKLRIWKDGLRFLRVILETSFLYRPARFLWLIAFLCLVYAALLLIKPAVFFAQHRAVEDWMIYRLIVICFAGFTSCLLACAGYLCAKIVMLTLSGHLVFERNRWWLKRCFANKFFWFFPGALFLTGLILILPGFLEYIQTAHIQSHWSRFLLMSLFFSSAIILSVTKLIDYLLDLIAARMSSLTK